MLNTPQKILADEIMKNRTPSVQYYFFNKDEIIERFAAGFADIEKKLAADEKTTYSAYSVTKTFTALAVMQLAQQGRLSIEDPVNEYLSVFPYNPAITIRQVLSHSAGIPNPIPLSWIHPVDKKEFPAAVFFLAVLAKYNKSVSRPNEKFSYSNVGYVLLGQIISKVSGLRYEEYVMNYIIRPLGIPPADLGFEISESSRHARGYHKRYSLSNLILGLLIDKSEYMEKSGGTWQPFKSFYVNGPSYGGLIGTPGSFIKYLQELLRPGCRLISDDYKSMMLTENRTIDGKPSKMCLSWFKGELNGHTYFAHAGGGGGYYCEIRIYPAEGLGSVIFFNRTGMTDERFLDKLDRFYF